MKAVTALVVALACAPASTWAELQASAIISTSSSLLRAPALFVGWNDPATGAGDVRAFDSHAATHARWSAAAMLQSRLDPAQRQAPRVLRSDGAGTASESSVMLAERFGPYALGAGRNANLWFVAPRTGHHPRPGMVYAGTLDGMLHGFDQEDGSERMAYVPRRIRTQVRQSAAAVDGPLFAGDAPLGPDGSRRTLLVAGLGMGGPGYVVLDVSEPSRFATASDTELVLADTTDSQDADLGQLHAPPVVDDAAPNRSRHIVQMANGRWALVIGNGYFSRAARPVLLVQYLDQGREILRLSPCLTGAPCAHASANGLSMPRLLDTDGDGRVDRAYAGDLQGNLWHFDLGGAESDWHARRVFTACDALGRRQAITTAPYVQAHPAGGWMLVIGTGRHLQDADGAAAEPQSLYGLHDGPSLAPLQSDSGDCRRPDILAPLVYEQIEPGRGADLHAVRGQPLPEGAQAPRGWWVDLPHAGQRVLHNPQGFEGYKLLVHSVVPIGGPQLPRGAGRSFVSVFNLLTGLAPSQPAFAITGDIQAMPLAAMGSAPPGPAVLLRRPGDVVLRYADGRQAALRTAATTGARVGWREQP